MMHADTKQACLAIAVVILGMIAAAHTVLFSWHVSTGSTTATTTEAPIAVASLLTDIRARLAGAPLIFGFCNFCGGLLLGRRLHLQEAGADLCVQEPTVERPAVELEGADVAAVELEGADVAAGVAAGQERSADEGVITFRIYDDVYIPMSRSHVHRDKLCKYAHTVMKKSRFCQKCCVSE